MKYTRITYKHDKKNNRHRFYYQGEYSDMHGHHQCSGNFFDVYPVTGHVVAVKYSTNPVLCCDSFNELCDIVRKETGCIPEQV